MKLRDRYYFWNHKTEDLCYGERTFQSVCMADRYVAALRKAYPQGDRRVVATERIFMSALALKKEN